ncbi:hypothetical protein Ddc_18658 [Ditylenchus destructor]|nr:hypothetical protein Ddc_18658 [Ditylenchus destructor]
MKVIQDVIEQINPFAKSYKMLKEVEKEVELEFEKIKKNDPTATMPKLKMVFTDKGVDRRRFNIPMVNEVAAIFKIDNEDEVPEDTGIVVHLKDDTNRNKMKVLNKWQKEKEALVYPLLFPTVTGKWTGLPETETKKPMTYQKYFRFGITTSGNTTVQKITIRYA